MYGDEVAAANPGGTAAPAGRTDGRFVDVPRSRFGSDPISTLYGRPEETSIIGATVKFPNTRFQKPSPLLPPGLRYTPLVIQRWRWSKSELPRSKAGKLLSCGAKRVERSVESSIECE